MGPQEDHTFELNLTVPTVNATKFCQLILNLTNPSKSYEKFGDTLLAMLEIEPLRAEPSEADDNIEIIEEENNEDGLEFEAEEAKKDDEKS